MISVHPITALSQSAPGGVRADAYRAKKKAPHRTAIQRTVDEMARSLSLSTGHISCQGEIEWAEGGTYVKSKAKYQGSKPERLKKARGKIRGFSRSSRRRLMNLAASLRRDQMVRPQAITLTQRDTDDRDMVKFHRDLDRWLQAADREYGRRYMTWRIEFQKNGSPHAHIQRFDDGLMDPQWLKDTWTKIHLGAAVETITLRTEVRRVKSWHGVMHYFSKYMCKLDDGGDDSPETGRLWGERNRDLKNVNIRVLRCTEPEAEEMQERIQLHLKLNGYSSRGAGLYRSLQCYMPEREIQSHLREMFGDEFCVKHGIDTKGYVQTDYEAIKQAGKLAAFLEKPPEKPPAPVPEPELEPLNDDTSAVQARVWAALTTSGEWF